MLEMEVKLPLRVIMLNFWRKYMVEEVSFNFDRMKISKLELQFRGLLYRWMRQHSAEIHSEHFPQTR